MSLRLFRSSLLILLVSAGTAFGQYSPLFTSTTFQKTVNVSKPVGVLDGTSGAGQTGAATYSIPIKCAPGTNGLTPKISIGYNSQSGNGLLGMGWSIEGLSVITRTGRDKYHDNVVAPVEYSYNDRFALDGVRLNSVSGTYGYNTSTYKLEADNFSTITSYNNVGNGPQWFRVTLKDGTIMDYGGNPDSRFLTDNSGEVMIWRLNRIQDVSGNYIEFEYSNVQSSKKTFIHKIKYTGNANTGLQPYNSIEFHYTVRSDMATLYESGSAIRSDELLEYIELRGENTQAYKRYFFNYGFDNITSYLKEVIEKDANYTELNSTIFKYGDQPVTNSQSGTNIAVPYLAYPFTGDVDIFTGDFDGDGKTDIMAAAYTQSLQTNLVKYHTDLKIYRNTGNNQYTQTFQMGLPQQSRIMGKPDEPNYFGFISSDYNGDGMDDILLAKTNYSGGVSYYNGVDIYYAQAGANFSSSPSVSIGAPSNYNKVYGSYKQFFLPGDFDGDGRMDYISLSSVSSGYNDDKAFVSFPALGQNNNPITISTGSTGPFISVGNTNPTTWARQLAEADRCYVIDFDGDGKQELMLIRGGETIVMTITKNTSNQYVATRLLSSGYPTVWHQVWTGDFNGDKKTDILTGSNGGQFEVAYSTGRSFIAFPHNLAHAFYETCSYSCGSWPNQSSGSMSGDRMYVSDFNGDGRSDILHYHVDCSCSGYSTLFDMYYSRGRDFTNASTYSAPLVSQAIRTLTDANGDGRTDLSFRDATSGGGAYLQTIFFKPNGTENLLHKVADGLGRITTYNYNLMTSGGSFYSQGSGTGYPLGSVTAGINLISSLSVPDGVGGQNTTTYNYAEAMLHKAGRGFLGFKKVVAQNNLANIKTEIINDIDGTCFTPYKKEENTFLVSTNAQLTHQVYNIAFVSTGNQSYAQRLNTLTDQDMLIGATTTTSNTYDNYGNITQKTVNVNNLETTVTNTTYVTANTPVPAKPSTVLVQKTRSGSATTTDGTSFTYDGLGRLSVMTENYNKLYKRLTTLGYNSFGNITARTITGTAIGYASANYYAYDSKGRFAISETNPLNQTSTCTWHPVWGKPLVTTSIDGTTQTNTYNTWGKLTSTVTPQNYTITYSEAWDINGGAYWYSYMSHPGRPDVKTWYDIMGREIKTMTEHYNGQWTTSNISYNSYGKMASTTKARLSSEPAFTTTFSYNDHRLVSLSNSPAGATGYTYAYGGAKATRTMISPTGQVSTAVTDAAGRKIESTDNGGKLTYTYTSRGDVASVKHWLQVALTNSYDDYGRKISTWDCDAGTTTYTYDAWGRIKTEKDANNKLHSFTYNAMDMVTQRSGPEGMTGYQYYGAGNGYANQLRTISGFNGVNESFNYDIFGRLIYKRKTIDSKNFETYYGYDEYDNVETVSYSSGFGYRNVYDGNGFLEEVKTPWGSNNTIFFTGSSINGDGKYTSYTLGDGRTTTKTYNYHLPATTYAPGVQNTEYWFDISSGNLDARWDHILNLKENFTYDNLNRLTSSCVTHLNWPQYMMAPINVDYDLYGSGNSDGNIKKKTDAGTYYYGSKRHGVAQVTNDQGLISQLQQDIVYTPFRKAESVKENNYEQIITYDASYNRVKTRLLHNGNLELTRYYMDDYEENIDPATNASTFIHYVNGGDGLCTIVEYNPTTYTATYHYVYKDHLGSILAVTDHNGNIELEQNFDAWGRRRNPADWTYNSIPSLPTWMYRGYTGHEHMPEFVLINMNGRMYDPILGRMLAPDNYIHGQYGTQGFNRFSYCLNNPLKFTDPNGEMPVLVAAVIYGAVIGAATSAVMYSVSAGPTWTWNGFGRAALFGGVSGAISGAIGGAFAGSAVGGSMALGIIKSTASQMLTSVIFNQDITAGSLIGSVAGGIVMGAMPQFNGIPDASATANAVGEIGASAVNGSVAGAVSNGIAAAIDGRNIVEGIGTGMMGGAIGGAVQSGMMVGMFGSAIVPDQSVRASIRSMNQKAGYSESQAPIFRRGGLYGLFTNRGVTWGRNLVVPAGDADTYTHEYAHYLQMVRDGYGYFQAKGIYEQGRATLSGGNWDPYSTPGTNEYEAQYFWRTFKW